MLPFPVPNKYFLYFLLFPSIEFGIATTVLYCIVSLLTVLLMYKINTGTNIDIKHNEKHKKAQTKTRGIQRGTSKGLNTEK